MNEEILIFEDASNFRGCLQVKRDGDSYFWGVDCEVHGMEWSPIPAYIYETLKKYSEEE